MAKSARRSRTEPRVPVRRIKATPKGIAAGLLFSTAWASAVTLAVLYSPIGKDILKLPGLQWGMAAGAFLFLLYQPPFSAIVLGILDVIPLMGWLLLPVKIAYYVVAAPGLSIARLFKLTELSGAGAGAGGKGGKGDAVPRGADMTGACPFEGRVVATGEVAYHNSEWTRGETILEIHEDWRVSSEKIRYWGWIDAEGAIHEGAGVGDRFEIDHEGGVRSGVVGQIRDRGLWLGDKKIGDYQRGR